MKSLLSILLIVMLMSCKAEAQYPMYDTSRGVVVYYDRELNVKADSAIFVKRADHTVCEEYKIIDCGFYGNTYHLPYWYEWRIILFLKDFVAIPVRQKISFHKN